MDYGHDRWPMPVKGAGQQLTRDLNNNNIIIIIIINS